MGLGIGKECERCTEQLNYEDGFNEQETLCRKCEAIIKFDLKIDEEKREYL